MLEFKAPWTEPIFSIDKWNLIRIPELATASKEELNQKIIQFQELLLDIDDPNILSIVQGEIELYDLFLKRGASAILQEAMEMYSTEFQEKQDHGPMEWNQVHVCDELKTCIYASKKYLAVGTSTGRIYISEKTDFIDAREQVTSLCISKYNRVLISGHRSGSIKVYSLNSLKLLLSVSSELHNSRIKQLEFISESKFVSVCENLVYRHLMFSGYIVSTKIFKSKTTIFCISLVLSDCVAILQPSRLDIIRTWPIKTVFKFRRDLKSNSGTIAIHKHTIYITWDSVVVVFKITDKLTKIFEKEMNQVFVCSTYFHPYLLLFTTQGTVSFCLGKEVESQTLDFSLVGMPKSLNSVSLGTKLYVLSTMGIYCGTFLFGTKRAFKIAQVCIKDSIDYCIELKFNMNSNYVSSVDYGDLTLISFDLVRLSKCLEKDLVLIVNYLEKINAKTFLTTEFYNFAVESGFKDLIMDVFCKKNYKVFLESCLSHLHQKKKFEKFEKMLISNKIIENNVPLYLRICQDENLYLGQLYLYSFLGKTKYGMDLVSQKSMESIFLFFDYMNKKTFQEASDWIFSNLNLVFQSLVPHGFFEKFSNLDLPEILWNFANFDKTKVYPVIIDLKMRYPLKTRLDSESLFQILLHYQETKNLNSEQVCFLLDLLPLTKTQLSLFLNNTPEIDRKIHYLQNNNDLVIFSLIKEQKQQESFEFLMSLDESSRTECFLKVAEELCRLNIINFGDFCVNCFLPSVINQLPLDLRSRVIEVIVWKKPKFNLPKEYITECIQNFALRNDEQNTLQLVLYYSDYHDCSDWLRVVDNLCLSKCFILQRLNRLEEALMILMLSNQSKETLKILQKQKFSLDFWKKAMENILNTENLNETLEVVLQNVPETKYLVLEVNCSCVSYLLCTLKVLNETTKIRKTIFEIQKQELLGHIIPKNKPELIVQNELCLKNEPTLDLEKAKQNIRLLFQ